MGESENKNFLRQLFNNALMNDIPLNGIFELTPLCNLDCRMCYIHLNDASVKDRMSDGQKWISIMKQAVSRGMLFAILTGGEAMTHPDFWDIYSFLNAEGVRVRVKTNGILLDEENIRRFTECPPFCIDVSLYGCNAESYIAVTGHDVFEKVAGNIRKAVEAGLNVRLMITPSRQMYPWIDEVLDFAAGFKLPVNVNSVLFDAREGTSRNIDDYGLTKSEYIYIAQKSKMMFNNNIDNEDGVSAGLSDKPGHTVLKGLQCGAARRAFAINWEGIMLPCLSFPKELIGENPEESGFYEAFVRMNRAVKEFKSPDECNICSHKEYCHYCPSKHGRYALINSCNTEFCDTWKGIIDINTGKTDMQAGLMNVVRTGCE